MEEALVSLSVFAERGAHRPVSVSATAARYPSSIQAASIATSSGPTANFDHDGTFFVSVRNGATGSGEPRRTASAAGSFVSTRPLDITIAKILPPAE